MHLADGVLLANAEVLGLFLAGLVAADYQAQRVHVVVPVLSYQLGESFLAFFVLHQVLGVLLRVCLTRKVWHDGRYYLRHFNQL